MVFKVSRNMSKLIGLIYFVIFILYVSIVNSNPTLQRDNSVVHRSLEPFSELSALETFRNGASGEFTIISPFIDSNSSNTTKRRRVIRRRKKVKSPSTSTEPSTITTVQHTEFDDNDVSIFKPHSKTRFHNKNRNVWKIPNLTQERLSYEDEPRQSILGKRESAEVSQNETKSVEENSPDLNTEESTNPFINTSTPISNELQNSLQFTLQMLHPLLNSDSVLSEKNHKIPEDKNIGLTHSLSGSFAQTPIAHDLGFLPTNLRKQHPLLNPDSIFSSEDGASKTGPRTHVHPTRNRTTFHINELESNNTVDTHKVSESKINKDDDRYESNSSLKPITSTVPSVSNSFSPTLGTSTTKTYSVSTQIVTVMPNTRATFTTKLLEVTTPLTTSVQPSSTLPTTADPKPDVEGVLNITEIMSSTETTSATDYKNPTKTPEKTDVGTFHVIEESSNHPPVIMFPLDEDRPSSTTPIKQETTTPPVPVSSLESSSAEQLLIEQLLGLGGPTSSPSSDSNELAQLFNLLQSQQSKRTPGSQNPPPSADSNQGFQNLIQSILQPQLNSGNNGNNNPQFDLGALLNLGLGSNKIPNVAPVQQDSFPPPKLQSQNDGLSDSDLKSIFALLDTQTSTTTPTTTTTTTTTTRPTTVRTTPVPFQLTTTLHPALQNMLDLFQNQLKPFQSIPSVPTPQLSKNLNPLVQPKETTTQIPAKPQQVPVSTPNSLDILSQLLNFGSLAGNSKVNPVRATPAPEFSLASIFGSNNQNQNIFPSNFPNPSVPAAAPVSQGTAPSESNQLLNFFGGQQSYQTTAPPSPNGLYYWLDMNAFLGGDPKADPMSGIRPKMGSRYPFLKVK